MDFNQTYRSSILAVAQNKAIKNLILNRGKDFSRRFVAGDTLEEAFRAVDELEKHSIHGILDLLGEMVSQEDQAHQFQQDIIKLVQAFAAKPYPRYIALKLTQLGLDLSEDLTHRLMLEILATAKKAVCFVRIDMEDSSRIDATLQIYKRLRQAGYINVGIVLQSYLQRSEKDLDDLLELKPAIRIVKGAYKEPASLAFQDKTLIVFGVS
jgi:proline dehydrogenase